MLTGVHLKNLSDASEFLHRVPDLSHATAVISGAASFELLAKGAQLDAAFQIE